MGIATAEGATGRWITPTRRYAVVAGVCLLLMLGVIQEGSVSERVANSALAVLAMATLLAFVEIIAGRRGVQPSKSADVSTQVRTATWAAAAAVVVTGSALAVQTWFGTASIAGGDIPPPDGAAWLGRLFAPWIWSGSDLGSPGTLELQLPWAAILGLVNFAGGHAALAQRIWYTTAFTGAAVSALFLLKTLGASPLPAAIGAAVSVFNPYVLTLNVSPVYLVALALVALIPTLILRASRSQTPVWRAAVFIGVCAPLLGYAYNNPPLVGMVLAFAIGSPFLAWWLWGGQAARRASLATALGLVLLVIASAYWIVPVAVQLHLTAILGSLPAASSWTWTEVRATISNAFWLNTNWAWLPEYFPFAPEYSRPPLSMLKFVLPAVAFSALYVAHRHSTEKFDSGEIGLPVVAAASVIALLVVVLSTGTRPPGNLVFDPLYRLPYGWLLREPGRFLMLAGLAYAILVSTVAERICRIRLSTGWPTNLRGVPFGPAAAILLGGAISLGLDFPLAIGTVVPNAGPQLPSSHVRLPGYWTGMAAYVDRAPFDGPVLIAPPDDFYQMPYRWGYYGSDGFIADLMKRSVLDPNPQGYVQTNRTLIDAVDLVAGSLLHNDWAEADRLLQSLGSPLILVRGDIDSSFSGRSIVDPALLRSALERAPNFRLLHVAGPLALFAAITPMPPRLAIAHSFATVDSTSPDLRALSLLPSGADVVSAPAIPGVIRVSQVPPFSSWDFGVGQLQINLAEPVGWQYQLGVLKSDQPARLVDPVANPNALSPFVPLTMPAQTGNQGTLAVRLPLGGSLITDGAFQSGMWQGVVGDCQATGVSPAGPLDANLVRDGPNGFPALRLSARARSACEARDISWNGGLVLIDLWTRHVSGAAPRFCVFEIGPHRCAPISTESRGTGWVEHIIGVTPESGTTGLVLFVYADGDPTAAPTVNDYADIAVYSVPSTNLVLVGFPNVSTNEATSQLLVERESYSEGWTGPPRSRHVLVDGMTNGWLIGQTSSGSHTKYTPSTLVELGLWASGGALAIILMLALSLLPLQHLWAQARRH